MRDLGFLASARLTRCSLASTRYPPEAEVGGSNPFASAPDVGMLAVLPVAGVPG